MSQILVTGEAKIRDIQGPVVSNSGVITALDGDASQYVRGDGTLADFPTSTGGGSSVSYYLNTSVSQGTIGGVAYKQLGKTPISGAGTDIAISTTGYVASYLTDANDPALLEVPAGNFNCEFYFSVNNNTGNPFVYAEVYKYDGAAFTLLGTSVGVPEYINQGTVINPYYFAVPVAVAALTVTDRIAIRIYVNVDGRTVTLHTENNHLCQVVTTFSKGLISLNNLTRQNQFFGTGTSGTDFNISSATATHTFNIPSASDTNRGLITTGTQTIAGDKTLNGNTDFVGNSDFSGYAIFSNAIPTQINYGAKIAKGSIPATFGSDSVNLYSDITTNNIIFRDNLSIAKLLFNNSTQTFTFPAASGTIALTSDISYPVTSVFGRTGAVVATEGDYSLTQLSDVTITSPSSGQVLKYNGTAWINDTDANTGTVTSVGLSSATSGVTIGSSPITTSGTITLAIATASGSQNGLLSSTDWTTFNNKANALSGTINTIAYWDSATTIASLALATYPSLTELSYVKGVTSAIQTQLNGKQGTLTLTTTGTSGAATLVGTTLNIPNYASGVSGTGTTNTLPKFTAASTIGNSNITDDGSTITLGSNSYVNGSLGVGVTPIFKLQVFNSAAGAIARFHSGGSDGRFSANSGVFDISSTGSILSFSAGSAERMRITTAGRLLIGTTTESTFLLDVNGTARVSGQLTANSFVPTSSTIPTNGMYLSAANTLNFATNTTNRLSISSTGNVSIGTTSALQTLTLAGTQMMYNTAGDGVTNVVIGSITSQVRSFGVGIATSSFASIQFATDSTLWYKGEIRFLTNGSDGTASAGTERMRIFSNGNTFIGSSPTDAGYKLDVNGTGRFSGALTGTSATFSSSATATAFIPSGATVPTNGMYLSAANTLNFATNTTERMRITSGGNVLVGTTSENSYGANVTSIQMNGVSGSLYETRHNGTSGLRVGSSSDHCYLFDPRNNDMRFSTFDTLRMTISGGGVVTIANLAGTGSRAVLADASGVLSAPVSDISVKQNITSIGYGLNEILKMNPVWFDFIDEYKNYGEGRQNGNIAQEIEAIIPEAVFVTPSTGKMGINYDQLHAVYIKAIQELKLEIEQLKNK